MNAIKYHLLRAAINLSYLVIHTVLSVLNWRRRKQIEPVNNPLLLKSATALAKEIREGKTRSHDVVQAYIARIWEIDYYTNATTECCFQRALEEARRADALIASGEFTKDQLAEHMPLLGVPFTVKLILTVKGLRCSAGSKLFEHTKASADSPCVTLMKNSGAIVLATTNIPEFGLHAETSNFLHGRTCNPYDNRRTSGGSSGGEAALIGAAGSVIGLGNDLAGSIRLPCHFTGIFGHKPSAGLVPSRGSYPLIEVMQKYLCTGPMCRYAEDLVVSMRVLTMENRIPLRFGQAVDFKQIKICYMLEVTHPLAYRVDKEIAQGLRKAVHHFQSSHDSEAKEIVVPFLFNAAKSQVYDIISRLDKRKDLKDLVTCGKGTHLNETSDLLKYFIGKSTLSEAPLFLFHAFKSSLTYDESNIPRYRKLLKSLEEAFDQILKDDKTVLLLPTFPTTATFHNEIYPLLPSCCYMSVFNLLGLPATQCPIGLDKQGMPYGIQVVSRKNNDPLTIACAVELEKAFGGWVPPGRVETIRT